MNVKVVIHPAEEGGYWAEVPSLPGCVSQGETLDELIDSVREAIEAFLSVESVLPHDPQSRVIEIAV